MRQDSVVLCSRGRAGARESRRPSWSATTTSVRPCVCGIAGRRVPLLPASRSEALRTRLGIGDDELAVWQDMSRRMFVPFLGDGIISQFEGYEDLEELDWDAYRAKYGNIQPLHPTLPAAGHTPTPT